MSLFQVLNNFFDAIYVITIERAEERHQGLKEELDGLNYIIHWGVDGKNLNYDYIIEKGLYNSEKAKTHRHDGNDLTLGEIGCALSHREIYIDMLKRGYEKILILEDDIRINDTLETDVTSALQELPDDWESLYLGYKQNESINGRKLQLYSRMLFIYPFLYLFNIKRFNPFALRRRFTREYSEHLDFSGYHYGTHAYGLTKRGAEKLLNHQTPVMQAADHALATMCIHGKIKSFNIRKKVIHQERVKFESLIDDRVQNSDSSPLNKKN